MSYKLPPIEEFIKWLEGLGSRMCGGYTRTMGVNSCPLRFWQPFANVGFYSGNEDLPQWARDFIKWADGIPLPFNMIPASVALAHLAPHSHGDAPTPK
jgi:hypothetical protein